MGLTKSPIFYYGAIVLSAISFWSSGIFLIRFLDTLDTWSSPLLLSIVYLLSVPVIYVSIRGVKNFFRLFFTSIRGVVYYITSLVLILHAVILPLFPTWYHLASGPALFAAAWLLWFGGVVIFLATRYDAASALPTHQNKPAKI